MFAPALRLVDAMYSAERRGGEALDIAQCYLPENGYRPIAVPTTFSY